MAYQNSGHGYRNVYDHATNGDNNMMDVQTMDELQSKAAYHARVNKLQPKTFSEDELLNMSDGDISGLKDIPDFGHYRPQGWKRFNVKDIKSKLTHQYKIYDGNKNHGTLFCDASGFGRSDEPAMTLYECLETIQELNYIRPGLGYGIVRTGQFQIDLGVFVEA